jgi:hypothetical protein
VAENKTKINFRQLGNLILLLCIFIKFLNKKNLVKKFEICPIVKVTNYLKLTLATVSQKCSKSEKNFIEKTSNYCENPPKFSTMGRIFKNGPKKYFLICQFGTPFKRPLLPLRNTKTVQIPNNPIISPLLVF